MHRSVIRVFVLLPFCTALVGCGEGPSNEVDYDSYGSTYSEGEYSTDRYSGSLRGSYDEDEAREPFDEDAARGAAEQELALQGYDYSYGCTDDCSGHEAGWQWRADNGYSTYGNSQSFAEGGYAFDEALEARVDEMRDDYEAGYEPDY